MVQGLVLSEPVLFTSLSNIIRAQRSVLDLAYSLMAISATLLNSVCAHHHTLMWHRYRLWLYVSVHAILVCVVWAFSSVSMLMHACCCSLQYSLRHALSLQHKNTHKYTNQETQVCSCPVNILSFCSGVLAMGNLIKVLGKDLENCPHFFLDFESKSLLGVASCTVFVLWCVCTEMCLCVLWETGFQGKLVKSWY